MDKLTSFWAIVVDVWKHGLFGVQIDRILIAVGIFVLFLVFRRLFIRFVLGRFEAWAEATHTEFDDHAVSALKKPMGLVPVVLGVYVVAEYLGLEDPFGTLAEKTVRSLIVFVLFWAFFNLVQPLSFLFKRLEAVFTPSIMEWLLKTIKGAFVFVGAATILEIWGIRVGPILAGLGLFGVAVALGAQDLFKNLIAGILVISERRFDVGDWILVEGVVEGTVEKIGFRSTLVRRFDKAPMFVPNSKLSDNAMTNFSAMTYRRVYWMIGVLYDTSVDQLRRVRDEIEAYVLDNPEFVKPPDAPLFVRIDRFGDSSIDIMLYCFTKTTVWGEWLKIKETLAYRIKEIVEGAGTSFAFPSRSIYMASVSSEAPEPFIPPSESRVRDSAEQGSEAGSA